MAQHVSYTPTFHHTNWVDKIDRVEADGPNGFNTRFNAIGADLRQLSTVVTQIGAGIADFHAPPDPPQQLMTFSPVFRNVPSRGTAWLNRPDGTAVAQTQLHGDVFFGVVNLALPAQVRLTTMRVLGNLIPDDLLQAVGTVVLSRTQVRLTAGQPVVEQVVSATTNVGFGAIDLLSTATGQVAQIDPNTYRYFLTAIFDCPDGVFPTTSMTIESIQLAFVPA